MPLSNFKISLKELKKVDKWMIISIILITSFGIVNIYLAKKTTAGGMLFPVKQSVFFIASLVLLYFVLAIDYSIIKAFTPIFYWGSIALLVLVLIIGSTINGAQGWIRLGPLSFQPAELAKIGTIMMMGKKLDDMDGDRIKLHQGTDTGDDHTVLDKHGAHRTVQTYRFLLQI